MWRKWFRRLFLILAWVAALALAFLPLTPAPAGGCRPATTAYVTYQQHHYQQAYSAPVTYQQHHVAPIKAVKVEVSPDVYSSVNDYYRDSILVNAVAGKTAELVGLQQQIQQLQSGQQQIGQLLLQQQQRQGSTGLPDAGGAEPQGRDSAPSSSPRSADVPPALRGIVQRSCIRCHGGNAADRGGGFDLRDLSAIDREHRLLTYLHVNTGEMPKSAKPLSDEEVSVVKEWVKMAGATSRR